MHSDVPSVSDLITLSAPGATVDTISYTSLWLLYRPGTVVVAREADLQDSSVFQITKTKAPIRKIDVRGRVSYHDSFVRYRQYKFSKSNIKLHVLSEALDPFEGHLPIAELPFIPLTFLPDHEQKKLTLIARGKKYWELEGQHLREVQDSFDLEGTPTVSRSVTPISI